MSPLHLNRGPLLRAFLPVWLPPAPPALDGLDMFDRDGWRPESLDYDPAYYEAKRKDYQAAFAFLKDATVPHPAARALRDTLAACREQGARPVLLVMPESSDFRLWYPPAARAAFDELLRRLSREFDCPLVNAAEWMPDQAFTDPAHLHAKGASAFTRRFGTEVLVPLLKGETPRGE
jgi:hypothetical protein